MMARTYTIGEKQISLDDVEAVRGLNADELAILLTLTQQTPPDPEDTDPEFPAQQPPEGTGLVMLVPAASVPEDAESQP
ncbi:hypothetical protein DC31_05790 [Microbacterium sp. CH12i]|uniref:hypothetical protein n=1 Tax=Microbacterium sp. CH12i TaxID=1479651 RepID=UPI000461C78A|nr:hypothetical protein [Microbacterium sp. CH12i]KDA04647.1 hypothetical protein DC31_05790 [Microbacterium sp. CH12i]